MKDGWQLRDRTQLQWDGDDLAVGVRTLPSCRRLGVPGERGLAALLA